MISKWDVFYLCGINSSISKTVFLNLGKVEAGSFMGTLELGITNCLSSIQPNLLRTFSKIEPAQLLLAQHWRSSYVDNWLFLILRIY